MEDCFGPVKKSLYYVQLHFPCLTFIIILRSTVILMFDLGPGEQKGSKGGISVSFLNLYVDLA